MVCVFTPTAAASSARDAPRSARSTASRLCRLVPFRPRCEFLLATHQVLRIHNDLATLTTRTVRKPQVERGEASRSLFASSSDPEAAVVCGLHVDGARGSRSE